MSEEVSDSQELQQLPLICLFPGLGNKLVVYLHRYFVVIDSNFITVVIPGKKPYERLEG